LTKRYRKPGGNAAARDTRALADASGAQVLTLKPQAGRISPQPQITRWTPWYNYVELPFDTVVAILRAAEIGETEPWGDLTRRMLASDDHLYSVYETRINAVAGSKWKLNPGQGDEALAKRAAEDCERALRSIPNLERVFSDMLDGTFTGYAVEEIIWEPRGDEWLPVEIIWLHPRRFRFDDFFQPYLYDDGMAAFEAKKAGREVMSSRGVQGIPLTPNKYIVHIPRSLPNYPMSSGVLMSCVRPWWVKQWVTKYWLSGAEVAGNPRFWGTAPQAADRAVFAELHSALSTLAADGVGVFREGTNVNVQSPLAQGSGSVWQQLYDNCNAAMSKAVLGSTLNVEIGDTGGNRAAAESQGDLTITPRAMRDARGMWATLQRDLLRPYLFFNRHRYGGAMPPVPVGETIMVEPAAEVDELIVAKGAVSYDELRQSRNLEPWGAERGGDKPIPAETIAAPDTFGATPSEPAMPSLTPTPDAAEGVPVEKAADAALNGAQVESLLEIVSRVASGQIPRATGISLITAAFPLTPQQAEQIMGQVGAGFVPTPEGGTPPVAATEEAPAALPLRDQLRPWEVALRIATSTTSRSPTK